MARDGGGPPLDEAALAISAALNPGLDEIEWLAALDLLAGECPTPTADGVARGRNGGVDLTFSDDHTIVAIRQLRAEHHRRRAQLGGETRDLDGPHTPWTGYEKGVDLVFRGWRWRLDGILTRRRG